MFSGADVPDHQHYLRSLPVPAHQNSYLYPVVSKAPCKSLSCISLEIVGSMAGRAKPAVAMWTYDVESKNKAPTAARPEAGATEDCPPGPPLPAAPSPLSDSLPLLPLLLLAARAIGTTDEEALTRLLLLGVKLTDHLGPSMGSLSAGTNPRPITPCCFECEEEVEEEGKDVVPGSLHVETLGGEGGLSFLGF